MQRMRNAFTTLSTCLSFPAKIAADNLILFRHLVCPTVALAAAAAARVRVVWLLDSLVEVLVSQGRQAVPT